VPKTSFSRLHGDFFYLSRLVMGWASEGKKKGLVIRLTLLTNPIKSTGWWLSHPSEKYDFVSWDDEIPNRWKNKIHVPHYQ